MGVVKEWQAMANQVEDLPDAVLSPELQDKVRRVIAANAEGATHAERVEDAEELMLMLGVHPEQKNEGALTLSTKVRHLNRLTSDFFPVER